jgi:adenosylcobinamide kinase/adenosylcobinamide-phosphate guanylyltransferase
MSRTLILGGSRSGKSVHAEQLASASGKEVVYIATAHAGDGEMAGRIAHHRQQRPAHWTTVEEPVALGATLRRWAAPHRVLLVDCLTLWLTNLLFSERTDYPDVGQIPLPPTFQRERADFLAALQECTHDVILVSNEVGLGIVPYGAISRCFADEAGRLNQATAALCENARFIAAGLPLVLKGMPC